MGKAVQAPVQERYKPAQGKIVVPPPPDPVASVPWEARDLGDRRAILVNERATVFDRALPPMAKPEEAIAEITPMGPAPTEWTPDLVHCRFVRTYAAMSALPRALMPAGIRSVLGQLQPQSAGGERRPLSAADADMIDAISRLIAGYSEDDQAIVIGFMTGQSFRDVADELQKLQRRGIGIGKGIGKDAAYRRYRAMLAGLAEAWTRIGEPIDSDTVRVWTTAAKKQ